MPFVRVVASCRTWLIAALLLLIPHHPISGQELAAAELAAYEPTLPGESGNTPEPVELIGQPDPAEITAIDAETPLPAAGEPTVITHPDQEVSPHVRRFRYRLKLGVRGAYDDNLNLSNTDPIEDFFVAVEPAIMVGFGNSQSGENFVQAEYRPIYTAYVDHSDFNTFQHLFDASGQWTINRLRLGLSQQVQILEGPDIDLLRNVSGVPYNNINLDAGGRRKTNIFSTALNASYDLTGKTFLTSRVTWGINDPEGLIATQTIAGDVAVNYRYGGKVTFGLGAGMGHQFVESPSPDSTYQEVDLRATYEATGKLTFVGSAGVQFRSADGSDQDYTTPIFNLAVNYQPFDGTTVNLAGTRRVTASAALAGQDFSATDIVLSVRQRLFQRYLLSLLTGYDNLNYFSSVNGVDSGREDNYQFVQVALDVKLKDYLFLGVYGVHRENDSTASMFSFVENQVGFRAGFQY